MGVEDLQPAHQQHGHADRIDPMRDTHPERMDRLAFVRVQARPGRFVLRRLDGHGLALAPNPWWMLQFTSR